MEELELVKMEALKTENLELKLADIRKDVSNLKLDLHRHLDMILEKVSATNGSVAKALERIYSLERQDSKVKIEDLRRDFEKYKNDTVFWHLIAKNKWVAALIFFALYAMSISEIREMFFTLLNLK